MKPEFTLNLFLFKEGAAITRAVNNLLRQKMLGTIHIKGPLTVTALKNEMKILQTVASNQLKVLREAGFVVAERVGNKIYYSINYKRLSEVQTHLHKIVDQAATSDVAIAGKPIRKSTAQNSKQR